EFAMGMLSQIDEEPEYLNRILFSDESTFHVSGKVNGHNVRIWGTENPHEVMEHERDSPKVNVWCGLMHDHVVGPFVFAKPTINMNTYVDMLTEFVIPQVQDMQPNIIFQQDGAPPHWGLIVRATLDAHFPDRWIGRDGPIAWPPRSPDITPLDFFLWGYVKDIVFRTKVTGLQDLK